MIQTTYITTSITRFVTLTTFFALGSAAITLTAQTQPTPEPQKKAAEVSISSSTETTPLKRSKKEVKSTHSCSVKGHDCV